MRRSVVLYAVLLAGALYSGAVVISTQIRDCVLWYRTPPADREALILGDYTPVVRKVRAQVREDEGILLVSDIDPAPLPYALFPRRVWQLQTEPETNAVFMDLPESGYPLRRPEDFPASWRLDFLRDNAPFGGTLTRLDPAGGAR